MWQMAIYKTESTGIGNQMREIQGTRDIFTRNSGISPRIPGNIIILISREKFKKIAGNVRENSG